MLIFFWKSGGTGISKKHHWKLQLCMLQGGLFRGRPRPFISRVYLLLSKSSGWMLLTQEESWHLFNFTFRLPWGYLLLVASNTKFFGQRPQGMQRRGKMVQLCQQIENHWFGMGEPPKFRTQRDSGLSVTLSIKMLVKDPWRQFEVKLSQWREILSVLQISVSTKRKWKYLLPRCCCCCYVASVVSDSVRPHRQQPTRLSHPWDSPGKNTGVGCHFLLQCMKVKRESEVAQSCPTPSDPMDCSPPGPSVHGIFQARVLEWGAIAFSASTTLQCL